MYEIKILKLPFIALFLRSFDDSNIWTSFREELNEITLAVLTRWIEGMAKYLKKSADISR